MPHAPHRARTQRHEQSPSSVVLLTAALPAACWRVAACLDELAVPKAASDAADLLRTAASVSAGSAPLALGDLTRPSSVRRGAQPTAEPVAVAARRLLGPQRLTASRQALSSNDHTPTERAVTAHATASFIAELLFAPGPGGPAGPLRLDAAAEEARRLAEAAQELEVVEARYGHSHLVEAGLGQVLCQDLGSPTPPPRSGPHEARVWELARWAVRERSEPAGVALSRLPWLATCDEEVVEVSLGLTPEWSGSLTSLVTTATAVMKMPRRP